MPSVASESVAFDPSSVVLTEKWNAEGIRTAMTAIKSRDELSWAAVPLMTCSENRTPPAKKHLEVSSEVLFGGERLTCRAQAICWRGYFQPGTTAQPRAHT